MSLRTSLLKVVQKIREIPGPTRLDIYTTRVVLRTKTWSSGAAQLGTATVTDLEILPRPRVEKISEEGRLRVGPIMPASAAGGYTLSQLIPADAAGSEYYYSVTGPEAVARVYMPRWIDDRHPFSYFLILEPDERRQPF